MFSFLPSRQSAIRFGLALSLTLPLLGSPAAHLMAAAPESMAQHLEATGQYDEILRIPAINYREEWVHLGSYSVRADTAEEGAKQLHVVYTSREDLRFFKKHGQFADGAIIIKDVFATKTEDLTTGTASYAGELAGRFVMVKDAANINADKSPLWGDGWGWAFFEGNETDKTVTTDYRQDCLGCHEPARNSDLLYLQGYPLLQAR